MAAITLSPPPGQAPYRQIRLGSGAVARPDFANGGRVTVDNESDATELEREGWLRMPTVAKRAPIFASARREAGFAELAKYAPDVAKALAGLCDRFAELEAMVARIGPLPQFLTDAPPNGAMHAALESIDAAALSGE